MSLRLICGRAGSGKSKIIYQEISNRINEEKKIYIITPEQFSYAAEKKLLETLQTGAVIKAEVLSFNRMAHRVAMEVGGSANTKLSSVGKAMLIYKILEDTKKDLKFLGKTEENIDIIDRQLTEFKKHKVTIEDLKNVIENIQNEYLKLKLKDIELIYEKFEKQIKDKYIDENDSLSILEKQLEYTDMFKDVVIYIDEFTGFTKQEYDIIKRLLKKAKQVNITICTNNLDTGTDRDIDLFYSNKQTAGKLLYIARSNKIECEKTVFLDEIKRFKNDELMHLEKNIYENLYKPYNKKTENLKLFLASNNYSEIENVAKQITKLIRNKNYRYKDICVICKNLETYGSLSKVIFEEYNIPVFIDEKKDLGQNILIKYIISIIDIFAKNWSYDSIFNYIKTGFLEINEDEIYLLENFCIKWGIKGSKWYKEKWNFVEETEENKQENERLEELRKQITEPLISLKEKLSGTKTVSQISKELYNFLIENKIDEKIKTMQNNLNESGNIENANELELAWNIIMQVLDEMVLVLGDEKISFEKYTKLLKTGLNTSSLGRIPQTSDQVIVGDINRSKANNPKIVFVIGLNDGVIPSINKDEGFLDDKDREHIKALGAEIAKTTIENLYEENLAIYKVFTMPEEKLYLSYSTSNLDGSVLRPSILVSKIKKIFPKLQEESDIVYNEAEILTTNSTFEKLIEKLSNLKEGKNIEEIWYQVFYYYFNDEKWKEKLLNALLAININNNPENINKENIDRLYGNTINTTVSRLEKYKACPFSYFLKYGLKLSEKEEFKINVADTGSFMHDVIDSFFSTINETDKNIKELSDDEIYKIIEEIINEKLALKSNYIFTSTQKYKILSGRLKNVVLKSMKYIIESLKYSDFEVYGNELEFKRGKEYEPIRISLDNGKNVEITGKIDRIDIAKTEDEKLIRIIDYKSSVKNIDLNEVVAGIQLQLLTYMDAVCNEEEQIAKKEINNKEKYTSEKECKKSIQLIPAGMLYFNLIDPIVKADRSMSDEQIEQEIRKQFKMQGYILADVKVVKMMDKRLQNGNSSVIPVYIDKDGNLSAGRSNIVTKEEFQNLQKYTNKIIKEISEEILSGSIKIEPYYKIKTKKTPCEYCNYKSICNFKAGKCGNDYNYIGNKSKEEILENIENMRK